MSEETIFREVDEELRRDKMRTGWRRYGPLLIGAAVLVVVLVAANEGWNWYQNGNATRSSDQFYAALDLEDGSDLAGAQKALDQVIAQGSGQYPVLAKFKQAGLLARQGKKDDALAAYDALATAQGNARLRGLALLLAANLLVDKGDVPGVKSRIQGLMVPNDPLHDAALETLGLTQYKSGDLNGARDSFETVVADPTSSNEARGRMQLYVGQLVAQGATPPSTGAAADATADAASGTPAATPSTPAANDNAAPADATTPAGVESSQPSTPDAALDLAVPAAPADVAAPDLGQSVLSTGAGLPTAPDATAPVLPDTTVAPAPDATPAPATTPASPAPATDAAPAAPDAAPAANPSSAQPAPATGTTGQ